MVVNTAAWKFVLLVLVKAAKGMPRLVRVMAALVVSENKIGSPTTISVPCQSKATLPPALVLNKYEFAKSIIIFPDSFNVAVETLPNSTSFVAPNPKLVLLAAALAAALVPEKKIGSTEERLWLNCHSLL